MLQKINTQLIIALAFVALLIIVAPVSATVVLDSTSTDPAVIGSGDEVLLSVNFHDDGEQRYDKVNDGTFLLDTWLEPGDTASERYVTILDGNGDRSIGHLFYGQAWTKTFRIKFDNDAPAGTYQFKTMFQYMKDGVPYGSPITEYLTLQVSKQGVIMGLANIVTSPTRVQPGDDYVAITAYLENAGRKDAKMTEFTLDLPEGFTASYANNNRYWAGYVAASEQEELTAYVDVADAVTAGVYEFVAHISYADIDDNIYETQVIFPLRVQDKPVLNVVESSGELLAGGKGELRVSVRNDGTETAENVDVRLIKESDQPFDLDARSDYIGTLLPGEEGVAVFPLSARSGATVKEHSFTVTLRAKGDSDRGDDDIYVFSDRATLTVSGAAPNYLLWVGLVVLALIVLGILFGIGRKK